MNEIEEVMTAAWARVKGEWAQELHTGEVALVTRDCHACETRLRAAVVLVDGRLVGSRAYCLMCLKVTDWTVVEVRGLRIVD